MHYSFLPHLRFSRMMYKFSLLLLFMVGVLQAQIENVSRIRVVQSNLINNSIHKLVIENGRVFLNGQSIPRANLPQELDLGAFDRFEYNYMAGMAPIININGKFFTVQNNRIVYVNPSLRDETAFNRFMDNKEAEGVSLQQELVPLEGNYAAIYRIRREDPVLFNRIRREQQLELRSEELAANIRLMPNGQNRNQKIAELRTLLDTIFEIRQQNQRAEIQRLNNQLELLNNEVRDRQVAKRQIIDQRLQELIKGE